MSKVPERVPAYNKRGEIVGYVLSSEVFASEHHKPAVYSDDGERIGVLTKRGVKFIDRISP